MKKVTFKALTTVLLLMSATYVKGQATGTEYKIQRGESIESIAKAHGVTVYDIMEANPNADGTFYAGMKIIIPAKRNEVKEEVHEEQAVGNSVSVMKAPEVANTDNETHKLGDVDFIGENIFSYQDFSGDGGKGFSGGLGFEVALGAKAWLSKTAYLKGLLGYKGRYLWYKSSTARAMTGDKHASGTFDSHSIYLPLYIGAKINNIFIEAGPYFDYIVYGKSEFSSGKNKMKGKVKDGKFSTGLSVKAGYNGFGVSFGLGLTDFADAKKCKEFFIGIACSY